MKEIIKSHLASIVVIAGILIFLIFWFNTKSAELAEAPPIAKKLANIENFDFNDALQVEILLETIERFTGSEAEKENWRREIEEYRVKYFTNKYFKEGSEKPGITSAVAESLFPKYLKFLFLYVISLILIFYIVKTAGLIKFVRSRRSPDSDNLSRWHKTVVILNKIFSAAAIFVLFSPVYVIAYAVKGTVTSDNYFLFILLLILGNGITITFVNKFYHYLVSESQKGYILCARVKNLDEDFSKITLKEIASLVIKGRSELLKDHIVNDIYQNASVSFSLVIKELVSFLITGIIITEMALNIQGHLCYEMMQRVLSKEYDIVLFIVLLIFMTLKISEIITDLAAMRSLKKYAN
ncbi:MAG: hypothetical protein HUU43_05610 [Ignavibacteriaceae bacterium]|nr:hypothetical protein [Ignavibacteriaceae bacterium]